MKAFEEELKKQASMLLEYSPESRQNIINLYKHGWKMCLNAILKEANRISDELFELPMCSELYNFINKELQDEWRI